MSVKVIDRDRGFHALFERMRQVESSYAKVGVLADEGEAGGLHEPGTTLTVAEIAAVNEFGTEDGHIPARSFVRSTFDEKREELADMGRKLMAGVIVGKVTVKSALDIMGASLAASIKAKIASSIPPPNAPSTALAKAKTGRTAKLFNKPVETVGAALAQAGALSAVKTLIDTGRMLGAVTWAIVTGGE